MKTLKNILTIAGLGLITSLNAQNSEKRDSIYNNKGQLEREIIEKGNGSDTINYKYDKDGRIIQRIMNGTMYGPEKISYKYDENGRLIEDILINGELKEETIYEYNKQGKESKSFFKIEYNGEMRHQSEEEYFYDSEGNFLEKLIREDTNGDGIYDNKGKCTCGNKKRAI